MKSNHRRLNYVDLLIAVAAIIILAIFLTVFFKDSAQIDFAAKETITITLRVKDIPAKHSGLIKNGDSISFAQDDLSLGTVKYVSYDDQTVEFLDKLTNTSTIYKSPDKRTALLLVEALAESKDGEYIISDRAIRKSDEIELCSATFAFTATVINIENNKE